MQVPCSSTYTSGLLTMRHHALSCYAVPCIATHCHTMPCHVILSFIMSFNIMPYHDMSVMLFVWKPAAPLSTLMSIYHDSRWPQQHIGPWWRIQSLQPSVSTTVTLPAGCRQTTNLHTGDTAPLYMVALWYYHCQEVCSIHYSHLCYYRSSVQALGTIYIKIPCSCAWYIIHYDSLWLGLVHYTLWFPVAVLGTLYIMIPCGWAWYIIYYDSLWLGLVRYTLYFPVVGLSTLYIMIPSGWAYSQWCHSNQSDMAIHTSQPIRCDHSYLATNEIWPYLPCIWKVLNVLQTSCLLLD